MSTNKEKLQAIVVATELAKKQADILKLKPSLGKIEQYKLEMCLDLIQRGEKIIKEFKGEL